MPSKVKELEEEVRLLKEKVDLLEKIHDLQKAIRAAEEVTKYVPWPYPVFPNYEPYPWSAGQTRITWNTTTTAGRNWKAEITTGGQA